MPASDWVRIQALFAQACQLPAPAREAFLERACGSEEALRHEVSSLLRAHARAGDFLEVKPHSDADIPVEAALSEGTRIGPWRVRRLIGCGGMGEVYEVERVDGDFYQIAALKLLRRDAAAQLDRFHAERNILARLDHAGIARLLDGGLTLDGRPWAVLEYVPGWSVTEWCRLHRTGIRLRLGLFMQTCDAVAYAHRNLIIHRDLKPSNILVDESGRVRLLDFGIAKLLNPADWAAGPATLTQIPLTPDYCAPEQLSGDAATTATDIYQLGLLLFELLTEQRPWNLKGMPLARALHALLEMDPPKPSEAAGHQVSPMASAGALRKDLDAIVARCLRKDPAARYPTVEALKLDIEHSLQSKPIAAREGAELYVFGRFLRRYRWIVVAVIALMLTLATGIVGFAWQARRAQEQAARAEATKTFLINVFNASNPIKASDKPRGQITARELLDAGSARIEKEFATQPALQIELLGITAQIYSELDEGERYAAQHHRYIEVARRFYGELHPAVINAYLQDADYYAKWPNLNEAEALRALDAVDPLIHRAGLDESPIRARWWKTRGTALYWNPARLSEDEAAWTHAVELYARTDPLDHNYVDSLMTLASISGGRLENDDRALALLQRARDAQGKVRDADDTDSGFIDLNMSGIEWNRGNFAAADAALVRAIGIFRRTWGEGRSAYWSAVSERALLLCKHGDRAAALELFNQVFTLLPADPSRNLRRGVAAVQATYGNCLNRLGRNQEAITMLESSERLRADTYWTPGSITRSRTALPDAYDRIGRYDDARRTFKAGLAARVTQNPRDSARVLEIRERWGRFLLTQGDAAGAEAELREVITLDHGRNLAFTALAHGDLALLALERHDATAALSSSRTALRVFGNVTGARDVRMEPYLWCIHAQALAQSGDNANALTFARNALEAYRRYDDPSSPDINETQVLVAKLIKEQSKAH